jgi:hypothetical protein
MVGLLGSISDPTENKVMFLFNFVGKIHPVRSRNRKSDLSKARSPDFFSQIRYRPSPDREKSRKTKKHVFDFSYWISKMEQVAVLRKTAVAHRGSGALRWVIEICCFLSFK